jgi:DNA-binding NarL/FixJ family response regulator
MSLLEGVPPPDGYDPAAVRVLIADGQALVSAGFRVLLEGERGLTVAAEAGSADEVLELARDCRPDVVLMDMTLPDGGGVEATRRLLADPALGHVRILMLSLFVADEDVVAALHAGAGGVLLKTADAEELVRAVRVVAEGQTLLSPSVARRLIARLARIPESSVPRPDALRELTAREREVVTLVALGLTNVDIARRLVVSPATAKTHVSRAMVKLRARDRSHLVVLAYEAGLVVPQMAQTP